MTGHDTTLSAGMPEAMGRMARTAGGTLLGRICDVVFELATGAVLGFEVEQGGGRSYVPALTPLRLVEGELLLPDEALYYRSDDLSALLAWRDPDSGGAIFPLSESRD